MDKVFSQLLAVQFLLVSAAGANTLYFQPKTELVCPDNTHSCNSDTTCCLLPDGQYGCCMYANAVCCSDNIHCCPTGSYCDVNTGSCDKDGVKFEWSKKAPANLYIPKVKKQPTSAEKIPSLNMEFQPHHHQQQLLQSIPWAKKLPGLKLKSLNISSLQAPASCSVSQTLCKSDSGLSGCCPFPNAVCCDKGQQCCPSGFQCNLKSSKCEKPTEETTKEKISLIPGHTLFALRDPAVCPDMHTVCPKEMTCCATGKETFACCPSPNATCCNDYKHCCPYGYTCDATTDQCVKKQVDMILVKLTKWTAEQTCPDMETTCPEGTTCCPLQGGAYGCCPYPQAVCCSDNYHCCPRGYTCDVRASKCQIISKALTCPDHQTQCSGGMTCCQIEEHVYGCCPFPQATCCSDDEHCCPKGYTCELKTSQCVLGSSHIQSSEQMVVCPDKSIQCPSSSTCCPLPSGSYGCCPYVKATCCSDGKHCCPEGYTCDLKEKQCVPGSSHIQSSEQMVVCPDKMTHCPSSSTCCPLTNGAYGCCPYIKAVCCEDHLHCCPNDYTCDIKAQKCMKHGTASILELSVLQSSIQTSASVKCSDDTYCSPGTTCCHVEGRYECCPIPEAKCCPDMKHCCPGNFICDPVRGRCRIETETPTKQISLTSLSAATTNVSFSCPDSQCPSGSTCCPISSTRFGCCPLPKAVCCQDNKHCCPKNYHCDLEHKRCVMGQTSLPLFEKFLPSKSLIAVEPAKKSIKFVMCPDYSECPDRNTCCLMNTGAWGCCPFMNAVCCDDHIHCCPSDYTCDVKDQKCIRHGIGIGFGELSVLQSGIQTSASVKCSHDAHCSPGMTCCSVENGYKCCPFPEAVCCIDREHCCPKSYFCDMEQSKCVSAKSSLNPIFSMFYLNLKPLKKSIP